MNLAQLIASSPLWAIAPEAVLPAVLRASANAGEWEAAKPSMQGKGNNKTAIIPIQGVLTNDGPAWYGSNYQTIAAAAEQAGSDPSVKRVILSVNSPGGQVTGLPETAAVIAAVAKIKPVSAIVEGTAASAAYWLTSQANDITLTPSGEVGSVGVRMMHVDISKMLDNEGYKITELQSGKHKTEWSPYKPLSEDAVNDMQPRIESMHKDFIDGIAAGRGNRTTEDIAAGRYGEGRMFSANDAMGHGLVDKIQSSREFYRTALPVQSEDAPTGFPIGPARARLEIAKRKV